MARSKKRASMREGPLADLFRSTDESVPPEEIKVTAKANGGGRVARRGAGPRRRLCPSRSPSRPRSRSPSRPPTRFPSQSPAQSRCRSRLRPSRSRDGQPSRDPPRGPRAADGRAGPRGPAPASAATSLRPRGRPRASPSCRAPTRPSCGWSGVGGAGVNAVNRMVEAELPGRRVRRDQHRPSVPADLERRRDPAHRRRDDPWAGRRIRSPSRLRAAFDEQDKIKELLKGSDMVFLASGAGGGTGTGAAPVVAKLARDIGALTVAAVTKPFAFEGARRAAQAEEGIAALGKEVDTMIVVPNERLLTDPRAAHLDHRRLPGRRRRPAPGGPGHLRPGHAPRPDQPRLRGRAHDHARRRRRDPRHRHGQSASTGRRWPPRRPSPRRCSRPRSRVRARCCSRSPAGPISSLIEASEAAEIVQEAAHPEAKIIFGASVDEDMSEEVWITVIATRFDSAFASRHRRDRRTEPREPRRPDRGAALRPERNDADPVGDWRAMPHVRHGSADELYGEATAVADWTAGHRAALDREPRPRRARVRAGRLSLLGGR